jgi:hypothetical protein
MSRCAAQIAKCQVRYIMALPTLKGDVLYQGGSVTRRHLAEQTQLMHDLQQLPASKVSDHPYLELDATLKGLMVVSDDCNTM